MFKINQYRALLEQWYVQRFKDDELSILDLAFNDIGRIVSGKLTVPDISVLRFKLFLIKENYNRRRFIKELSLGEASSKDILIFISQETHLNQFIPFYESFKSMYDIAFLSTKRNMIERLIQLNYPIQVMDGVNRNYDYSLRFTFRDDIFWLKKHGMYGRQLKSYLLQVQQQVQDWSSLFLNLFLISRPKVVLVGNDLTWEGRLFTRFARYFKVQSYSIQHGYMAKDWLQQYHIVNEFFVFGKISAERLKEQSTRTIPRIVGAPYLNFNAFKKAPRFAKELQDHGINKSFHLVCLSGYGHMTSQPHYFQILSLLHSVIAELSDHFFVIKIHPKESKEDYVTMKFKELDNCKVFSHLEASTVSSDIMDWISAARCLITGNSSTAFEAIHHGKLVASIDLYGEYENFEPVQSGAAVGISRKEDLILFCNDIDKLLEEHRPKMEQLKRDYFGGYSGLESARKMDAFIRESVLL